MSNDEEKIKKKEMKELSKIKLISDKYKFINWLGSGAFGDVYSALSLTDNKKYAIKIENRGNKSKSRLKDEKTIYGRMVKNGVTKGIPKIYNFLQTENCNFLVMDLLGKNLDSLFAISSKKFGFETIYRLAIEILIIIESVHNAGFIHRDIKPSNFLTSLDGKKIYLMDFGLAKQFLSDDKKKHISLRFERSLIGTPRFASLNVHRGYEPSRRDDLESIGYLLLYLTLGKLPWQGLRRDKDKNIDAIYEMKTCTSLKTLCDGLPECFHEYLKYCRELEFTDKPDYEKLRNLFVNEAKANKIGLKYIWIN